ncbi:hypothetical protein [Blastopirellula marina]|uniref:hypothetical protein n=1 Tax=Blastopirellula marina TaxID=124 RepID=UPI0011B0A6B3|nr:hypothetical protein [Blastopirellula marina]
MTRKRSTTRRGKRSSIGLVGGLLRGVAVEGMGIVLFASLLGYPMMTCNQKHVSCLDSEPTVIDTGMHMLLAQVGLVNDRD